MKSFLVVLLLLSTMWGQKRLAVAVEMISFPPHIQTDSQGNFTGYLRDLMDRWAEDDGMNIVYEVVPVKRIVYSLENHKLDVRIPDNPLWDTQEKKGLDIRYSQPAAKVHGGYVRLAASPKISDITGRTPIVGSMSGFSQYMIADRLERGELTLHEVNQNTSLMSLLQRGRVDVIYGDIPALVHLGESMIGKNSVMQCQDFPSEKSTYHLSAFRSHGAIARFDEWMQSEAGQENVKKLREKYGL